MTIYDDTDGLASAFDIDPETGELRNPEACDIARDDLFANLDQRIDRWCDAVRELEARSAARLVEADRIRDLAHRDEAKATRIRQTIMWAMQATGRQRIEAARNRLRIVKNGGKAPLEIVSEDDIPNVYFREEKKVVLDRDALRLALEQGGTVPGVVLKERGSRLAID